jgi:predicted transcriptional regulator
VTVVIQGESKMNESPTSADCIELATEIVSAYVSRNSVPVAELPGLIQSVHAALAKIGTAEVAKAQPEPLTPAVSVKKSVTPDYIICLEDGKRFKSLKRHLATSYGMSPDEYRAKWSLPADYPMVAPAYAAARSALAKSMGLGQKGPRVKAPAPVAAPPVAVAPAPVEKTRGRPRKAA